MKALCLKKNACGDCTAYGAQCVDTTPKKGRAKKI
jgi:hypothetical protein